GGGMRSWGPWAEEKLVVSVGSGPLGRVPRRTSGCRTIDGATGSLRSRERGFLDSPHTSRRASYPRARPRSAYFNVPNVLALKARRTESCCTSVYGLTAFRSSA